MKLGTTAARPTASSSVNKVVTKSFASDCIECKLFFAFLNSPKKYYTENTDLLQRVYVGYFISQDDPVAFVCCGHHLWAEGRCNELRGGVGRLHLALDQPGHPGAVAGVKSLVDLVEQVERSRVAP